MGNTVRIRNGMSNATEGDILGSIGDIVKTLGVVDLAGGHLLVTEDSPTGMTVQVAGGIVYVPNSNYDELDSDTPKFYPVVCDSEVVTIDNNVSGSTRIDIVCVKVDKAIAPNADADNIATKVVIKGTPGGGTPSTPANHYKLAEITVVNGETAIENSMITDKRGQVIFDERYIKLTTSTPTDLTGYLYGNGSKVETKGVEDGWTPAGETWIYQSVDNPTGVYKVNADVTSKYSEGMRIKMTNGGNVIKGIITKMGTYGGDEAGYTYISFLHEINPSTSQALHLMASGAITNPYYSMVKAPQGFPLDPSKWSVSGDVDMATTTIGARAYHTAKTISVPIGVWNLSAKAQANLSVFTSGSINIHFGFSGDTSTYTLLNGRIGRYEINAGNFTGISIWGTWNKVGITLTSKTNIYFIMNAYEPNTSTNWAIYFSHYDFTCAYL